MEKRKQVILSSVGFNKEVDNVIKHRCPFCGSTKLNREDFRDELSYKEYKISGICQKCINNIFK